MLVRKQVAVALERQHELMELASHAAFGGCVPELAECVLEARHCPADGDLGMLCHSLPRQVK